MDLKELGEFGLIDIIRQNAAKATNPNTTGIGDDCAIIPQRSGLDTLVSTDMLIEGAHFILKDIPPYRLGWKSAAVNISDIAAMGGTPTATFLAFALPPKGLEGSWMDEFLRGYGDISALYSCPLLGGDTTSSPSLLSICVSVLGECPHGLARKRSDAKEGDIICVTGSLGDSGGGLKCILEGAERGQDEQYLIERHYLPRPRVEEGKALAECHGVHAMMDISDGIGSDLRHILSSSQKGARVDLRSLPLSSQLTRCCNKYGWDALELATGGGEDYELLFTVSPEEEKALPVPHYAIGEILPQSEGLIWEGAAQNKDYQGFKHF